MLVLHRRYRHPIVPDRSRMDRCRSLLQQAHNRFVEHSARRLGSDSHCRGWAMAPERALARWWVMEQPSVLVEALGYWSPHLSPSVEPGSLSALPHQSTPYRLEQAPEQSE